MSSTLNSTSSPILANGTWDGSIESCKHYSSVCVSLWVDTQTQLQILHTDKFGNTQYPDVFTVEASTHFYAQRVTKSTHFKIMLANLNTETDQTVCRLVTRLSNSAPDNVNVRLDSSEDTVAAFLMTDQGPLQSNGNQELLVSQRDLSSQTDGVLSYGYSAALEGPVPLSVDNIGFLNVYSHHWPPMIDVPYCNDDLGTTPIQACGQGKLLRLHAFNDSAQLRYLRMYDASGTPSYESIPNVVLMLAPGVSSSFEIGVNYFTACYVVAASNPGKSTSYGTVDSGDVCVTMVFEIID
jgi:hypothetical protein